MADSETSFDNNLFSNHFLRERIDELEEWQKADLEDKYEAFVKLYEKNERLLGNSPNEDRTWDNFTSKVFKKILGHFDPQSEPSDTISGTEYNPDYTLFKDFGQFLDAQEDDEEFDVCYAIVENKRWDRTLDKSTQDHTNPAFQTYNYVDRLRVPWGILTNGKKWRLYSYEDCEADTFFQIDVVDDIVKEDDRETALRNFRYFYLFFSTEAFLPKQDGFSDKVLKGSFNYAESLEEDLEDRIYTALEETSRGFFEYNDIEKTEENVDLVHRSSLILLYRLLFVLNAESRELLPVSEDLYRNKLSLAHFREHLREEDENVFDEYDWAWDRLTRLFKAIDSGKEYGDYKITAYNGGLFRYPENADEDEEVDNENKFLANHKLRGTKLKEILKLLAVSKDEEDEEVLVDYKDLNIRHLGSVYEGLLEHELQIAEKDLLLEDGEWVAAADSSKDFSEAEETVEEGQAYITNESGERKATGSYYTPEYIVEYIVENTVKPKVENKIKEAEDKKEVLDKVLELNICDPAMGSGHFLTEATSFIAHKIAEKAELNGEVDDDNEIVWLKRQVVQNSIYGVDINPLAVELGKLSLWIETMSEGKPLSFLDHHLKVGNSLIGTSIEELEHHPGIEERPEADFEEIFGVENARTALHMEYKKIEEMPEETKEDVHEKEQAYKEFKDEFFYYKFLKKLSNVHTYLSFEEELSPKEYNQIRNEVMEIDEYEGEEWYDSAQEDATNRNYFHWELEFPKVFFSTNNGFDAIISNPPYVKIQNIPEDFREYAENNYQVSEGRYDLYGLFVEKSTTLTENSDISFILPNKFFESEAGYSLRKYLKNNNLLEEVLDFGFCQVFEDVTTYTCIMKTSEGSNSVEYREVKEIEKSSKYLKELEPAHIGYEHLELDGFVFVSDRQREVLSKLKDSSSELEKVSENISEGIVTGDNKIFIGELVKKGEEYWKVDFDGKEREFESELVHPLANGDTIERFGDNSTEKVILYPYREEKGKSVLIEEEELQSKFSKTYSYLKDHKDRLSSRGSDSMNYPKWYALWCPREKEIFDAEKLVTPDICKETKFTLDSDGGTYYADTAYGIELNEEISELEVLGQLNSSLTWFYISNTSSKLRGGFFRFKTSYLKPVPTKVGSDKQEEIEEHTRNALEYKKKYSKINLDIMDYLGNYAQGDTLEDLYTQLSSGVKDEPVSDTASDKEKLQVGSIDTRRNDNDVTVLVSARFKPENKNVYETDQYGYTETELIPALEFHDLTELQATLIEEFVPVAVDEAGGFADFRDSATKTMSLIDRLKKLTLPEPSDVEEELQKFIDQRNKADELKRKIERTDDLIDEIVYDLYDLTEEEIETVEAAI